MLRSRATCLFIGSGTISAVPDCPDARRRHAGESLLAQQEILTALLTLNAKAENLPLKAIMGAINHCFAMRDADMGLAFHSEALASTMQQLIVRRVHCNFLSQCVKPPLFLAPARCPLLKPVVGSVKHHPAM